MLAKPVCVLTHGSAAADRGWNSWLAFGCSGDNMTGSLTAQIVTETADAMVSTGLKEKGYEYVNLCVGLCSLLVRSSLVHSSNSPKPLFGLFFVRRAREWIELTTFPCSGVWTSAGMTAG